MENNTVKKRIFLSNTLMVLFTLSIFFIVNVVFMVIYFKMIEHNVVVDLSHAKTLHEIEDVLEEWTIHNYKFLALFVVDAIICILALILISQVFTKNLSAKIMQPIGVLSDGAKRIKNNNFKKDIEYKGYDEFEEVCDTFNDMQHHLLNAQETNKKYEKARTDMIAGISHDLRTPLTAIKGSVKAVLDGIPTSKEQQDKLLKVAYYRTGDMDRLINQLFYISKLETGNLQQQLTEVNISEYLDKYIEYIKTTTETKEEITIEKNNIDEKILIDWELLRRILDNLLENSRKYADVEQLKIKIETKKVDDMLDICFSDNGIGVDDDKIDLIFEEFYRADESRNRKKGNGLGLYIVKRLTESMNGKVSAENSNGLKIHLLFPIAKRR